MKTRVWGLLLLLAMGVIPLTGLGARGGTRTVTKGPPGRVVIILADGLAWDDFNRVSLPNLRELSWQGAVGLLNTNIPGRPRTGDGYPTLGAGTRVASAPGLGEAAGASENLGPNRAGDLYYRRTGIIASEGAIVHAGLGALELANLAQDYPVELGALGESLKRAGVARAVFGNADRPGAPGRQVVSVLMDSLGQVPEGNVGITTTMVDPSFPTGRRTDWERLASAVSEFLISGNPDGRRVVAIETGDLSRIQAEKERLIPDRRKELYRITLQRVDRFVGRLARQLDRERDLLLFISPTPAAERWLARDSLTPVIIWGRGVSPGLVYSATTRRGGVISNTDIAPTILAHYGLPSPVSFVGRPAGGIAAAGSSWATVDRLHERWVTVHVQRPIVVKGYVLFQIAAVLASMGATLAGARLPNWVWSFVLVLMALPLSMLVAAFMPPMALLPYGLLVTMIGAIIAGGALAVWRGRWLPAAGWVSLATVAGIALDVVGGGTGSTGSPLGYSAISGARYYGLGNEYMGVMIGGVLIGLSTLIDEWSLRPGVFSGVLAAVFSGVLGLIASPALGANFGGAVTAAIGFSVAYLRLGGRKLGRNELIRASLVLLLTLSGVMVWDLRRAPGTESHVGLALRLVWESRGEAIWGILHRKLAMNLKLLRSTIWSGALVTFLSTLLILSHRPAGVFREMTRTNPGLAVGISATALASVVALAVNDSGVVAAATMLIYPTGPLMYLANTAVAKDEGV